MNVSLRLAAGSFLFALISGCARQPQVQADSLPLKRVVIYRNGVGYFERGGHVDTDEVRFKMKQTEVGDFLATLAVMERGGSSVRAAAFPIDVQDGSEDDDEPVDPKHPKPPKTEDEKRGLKKIVLSLDGREHDLQVGYVAEAPVWRPSYRLVVHEAGDAELQAWGIVQNLSGEDWKDVKLSLVAGAPLAFEAQLGLPVIPPRPIVTDQGEVIAAVPQAETSLSQQMLPPMAQAAPPMPSAAPRGEAAEDDRDASLDEAEKKPSDKSPNKKDTKTRSKSAARHGAASTGMAGLSSGPGGGGAVAGDMGRYYAPASPASAPPPPPPRAISAPRNLSSLAAVAVESGTTRYDLPLTVTVPDKSATMVMLLSKKVEGEASFLFAPDGGVPDSSHNPFRVARFKNNTAGTLERGPIAVFEEGAFLGQGMVDPLPAAATATVPFALERSIAVDQERKYDELGERIQKIENGNLTIERDAQTQTKYRIRNGGDKAAKILVKHPRMNGTRLEKPPVGTEDNVGTGSALVPSVITPRSTGELVVDERATLRRGEDWFSQVAENAVKAFLADPKSDRGVAAKLQQAWASRKEILDKTDQRVKLAQEQQNIAQQTEETRRNLLAIEKNKTAEALRAKLTGRLGDMATRLDEITKRIVEIDSKLAELRVTFKETLRDVTYVSPLSKG